MGTTTGKIKQTKTPQPDTVSDPSQYGGFPQIWGETYSQSSSIWVKEFPWYTIQLLGYPFFAPFMEAPATAASPLESATVHNGFGLVLHGIWTGVARNIPRSNWWLITIYIYIYLLVGGFNRFEKYESQLGRIIPYIMEKMFQTTNQVYNIMNNIVQTRINHLPVITIDI